MNKMLAREIYEIIDKYAPFSLQCDWDNSGLLVGSGEKEVKKILLCLDITENIATYAKANDVDLVISHHPVIFKGLKNLDDKNPAVMLSNAKISAICCHTNVDRADYGLNEHLCSMLGFEKAEGVILGYDEGDGFGIVCKTDTEYTPTELAYKIKEVLGCDFVRFTGIGAGISRVGICTGSGGDFIDGAIKNCCDALITGDVKHNVFVDAHNRCFNIFDAGHFFTEKIFITYMKELLESLLKQADVDIIYCDNPPFSTV